MNVIALCDPKMLSHVYVQQMLVKLEIVKTPGNYLNKKELIRKLDQKKINK